MVAEANRFIYMQHSRKIVFNGMVMYLKIIVHTLLTLLATRVALKNLGADSFGLYNLLAGVIAMLSFLNGALVSSGQRFMSIAIGKKDYGELNKIFNVCFFIHLVFSLIILLAFSILGTFFISSILNIPEGMETTAYVMFMLMVVSSFVSVLVIPYTAIMNANEDIYVFALVEMLSSGLKCASAFAIALFASHKLEWYTLMMAFSLITAGGMKVLWSKTRYKETMLHKDLMLDKPLRSKMIGFVGWNTMGSFANVARNQGLAMLLNVFYGTVINAAYGIANQISALVSTISTTITTVFAPSITKAHGAGNDKRMIEIATISSKLTFGICSTAALPIFVFLPTILDVWLSNVPDYTLWFCRFIIIEFLLKQSAPGINRAIYATGKIKNFSIVISILLVSVLPLGYVLLKLGYNAYYVFAVLILAQILTVASEVYFAKKTIPVFDAYKFIRKSLLKPYVIFTLYLLTSFYLLGENDSVQPLLRVVAFGSCIALIYAATYIMLVLRKDMTFIVSKFKNKKS